MTMATRPRSSIGLTAASRRLIAPLVAVLATVPVLLALSVIAPSPVAGALSHRSTTLATVVAVATVLAVLAFPALGIMGRVGAVLLTIPTLAFSIAELFRASAFEPPTTGLMSLDALLTFLTPAGYFTLLFGALRALDRARRGAVIALVGSVALSAVLFAVPSTTATDIEMSDRMVYHGLINVGALVSGVATLIEFARRPARQSSSRESRK